IWAGGGCERQRYARNDESPTIDASEMAADLTSPDPSGSKRLRLAYVCSGDPLDVRTWSGTPFHMLEALRRRADVVEVIRKPWSTWFDLGRRALRRLSGGRYVVYCSPFWS